MRLSVATLQWVEPSFASCPGLCLICLIIGLRCRPHRDADDGDDVVERLLPVHPTPVQARDHKVGDGDPLRVVGGEDAGQHVQGLLQELGVYVGGQAQPSLLLLLLLRSQLHSLC